MLDKLIIEFDKVLKSLCNPNFKSSRVSPGEQFNEQDLTQEQKKHTIGLMRVNHCGEICAQALYQGQSLTSKTDEIRKFMEQASAEEVEHLAWTSNRIEELGGQVSILNPVFYLASLMIGIGAGMLGDEWSLGFLAETEHQVEKHLDLHIDKLPIEDVKSRAILTQMKEDEVSHAAKALNLGGRELPEPIKFGMKIFSKIMTSTTYHV